MWVCVPVVANEGLDVHFCRLYSTVSHVYKEKMTHQGLISLPLKGTSCCIFHGMLQTK